MPRPGPISRSYAASTVPARSPPPASATSRPTPHFQQHHAVTPPRIDGTAFRPGWLVATRLDSLLEAGRIDREQYDATHEWRRWVETIHPTATTRLDVRVDTVRATNDAGMLHRLAVATKLRTATEAIGPLRTKILEALIVHDRSWGELGRLLQVSDKTAMARAAEACAALADWRAGRSVAAPPVVRPRIQPGSW
jgi:hypothetical protein